MDICVFDKGELSRVLEFFYQTSLEEIQKNASRKNNPIQYSQEKTDFFKEKYREENFSQKIENEENIIFAVCKKKKILGAAILDVESGEILCFGVTTKHRELIAQNLVFEMARYMVKRDSESFLFVDSSVEEISIFKDLEFSDSDNASYTRKCTLIVEGGKQNGILFAFYKLTKWMYILLIISFIVCLGIKGGENREIEKSNKKHNEKLNENKLENNKPYIEKNLSYKTSTKDVFFQSDKDKAFYIFIEGNALNVDGLKDKKVEEKINGEFFSLAFRTKEVFVDNPSKKTRQSMMTKEPVIVSNPLSKVSYASKDLISGYVRDEFILGDRSKKYIALRGIILDVSTGDSYLLEDVINIDKDFAALWKKKLNKEYKDIRYFDKYTNKKLSKCFSVKDYTVDDYLIPVFFVGNDGIEIGFSYAESKKDLNGYVTISFSEKELESFKKKNSFWKKYK